MSQLPAPHPPREVPTFAHVHASDSREDELAWHLESLQGLDVDVVLRDRRRVPVIVGTHHSSGWSELDRRGDLVRLDPLGWVALGEVVCVVSHADHPTGH